MASGEGAWCVYVGHINLRVRLIFLEAEIGLARACVHTRLIDASEKNVTSHALLLMLGN